MLGLKGCIRSLKVNGELYDLTPKEGNNLNVATGCEQTGCGKIKPNCKCDGDMVPGGVRGNYDCPPGAGFPHPE